ncbi:MAG: hypothetical protein GY909_03330 [Oligoflexia bacterium]|nr:hypothetical protein [Oligoflexia bacterium]
MKKLIGLFLLLSQLTFANQWSIEKVKDTYNLTTRKSSKLYSYFIPTTGSVPKVIKEEMIGENLLKVIYYSGSAGTSQIVKSYRAVLIDKRTMKLIQDLPFKYELDKGSKLDLIQPEWSIKNNQLSVIDKESGVNFKYPLK